VNAVLILQVQEQISVSTAFSLTAGRIRAPRFTNPAEPLQQISTRGILQEVGLDAVEHLKR
jgi:hypothetical protein